MRFASSPLVRLASLTALFMHLPEVINEQSEARGCFTGGGAMASGGGSAAAAGAGDNGKGVEVDSRLAVIVHGQRLVDCARTKQQKLARHYEYSERRSLIQLARRVTRSACAYLCIPLTLPNLKVS